jgi:hypothetical protein
MDNESQTFTSPSINNGTLPVGESAFAFALKSESLKLKLSSLNSMCRCFSNSHGRSDQLEYVLLPQTNCICFVLTWLTHRIHTHIVDIIPLQMILLLSLFTDFLVAKSVSKLSATHVPTPYGYLHRDCYHEVPSGAQLVRAPEGGVIVRDRSGKRLGQIPACTVPSPFITKANFNSSSNLGTYNGWLAYTTYNNKPGIDTFLGTFSVPDEPVIVVL